jgi:hypothetical protein
MPDPTKRDVDVGIVRVARSQRIKDRGGRDHVRPSETR